MSRRKLQASTVTKVCVDVLSMLDTGLRYSVKWSRDEMGIGIYEILVDNLHQYVIVCPDLDDPEGQGQVGHITQYLHEHSLDVHATRVAAALKTRGYSAAKVTWSRACNNPGGVLHVLPPPEAKNQERYDWPCFPALIDGETDAKAFAQLLQQRLLIESAP